MKIISTNVAKPETISIKGKEEKTGIYKKPTEGPLFLTKNDVYKDEISNRLNHGGFYKACYVFSAEQYPYFKNLYPDLDWSWGMFGENLTVENFNETQLFLGDTYRLGEALVQVSQYREPCYKLAYKFGNQAIIKQFIEHGFGGTYLSILEEGNVTVNDEFVLQNRLEKTLSVAQLFNLVHSKTKDPAHLEIAANSTALPHKKRVWFTKFLK